MALRTAALPPLPRRAPRCPRPALVGRLELGDTHIYCVNFPSLFSLVFNEFVQSKLSLDSATEKNNEPGPALPAGSRPLGRKQPSIRLDLGKSPKPSLNFLLLSQPREDAFPGNISAVKGTGCSGHSGSRSRLLLTEDNLGAPAEARGNSQQRPQLRAEKTKWAFPTRSPFVISRQRSIWF